MIKTFRRPRRLRPAFAPALSWAVVVFGVTVTRALEVSEWKNRQPLAVEQPGVFKLALPPATLDLGRPGLEDLRLLDPAGRETPFIIEPPAPVVPATPSAVKSFIVTLTGAATEILLETRGGEPLDAVMLATPAPSFIKAARVEISSDGDTWQLVTPGALVFRQFGGEQLRLALGGRRGPHVRVTVDDTRTAPVPFTGATVRFVPTAPPVIVRPLEVRIVRREEFAGETVLTLDLGAAHVPLVSLEFATTESLFARNLTVSVREMRNETATERILAAGPIYRVAAEGLPASAQLELPVDFTAPSRELLVHIANGDSPPLAIDSVRAQQRPRWFVFRAAEAGGYTVLTGNAQCPAPHYDLAALAPALTSASPSALAIGPAENSPGYRRPETLPDTTLPGAPIDLSMWSYSKPITLAAAGVQELELDLDVLARVQPSLADLRLLREGNQLPYLLERPALSHTVPLTLTPIHAPGQRPGVSRWTIALPRPGFRLERLTLASPTSLFQRHLRILGPRTDTRGETGEFALAEIDWIKTPGDARPLTISFPTPATAAPVLEIDNGDNPPIALVSAVATYRVARLLFKAEPGPLALYYGNGAALAPRYDLSLVASRILAAEKSIAVLGSEEKMHGESWSRNVFSGTAGGAIFWGALALVVLALLIVIARLLPKPPDA